MSDNQQVLIVLACRALLMPQLNPLIFATLLFSFSSGIEHNDDMSAIITLQPSFQVGAVTGFEQDDLHKMGHQQKTKAHLICMADVSRESDQHHASQCNIRSITRALSSSQRGHLSVPEAF